MSEILQELVDSRGVAVRVDRGRGVIRGVKILGPSSRNGRRYPPQTLAEAAPLYEGAKVNVNHPKGSPAGPRDYQDRIGVIRGVAVRTDQGLFGDLHYNPKHALAEQLAWDAEHAPENVGLSHNVEARTARRDGQVVVEAITRVQSVDLVADPATTRGLFESQDPDAIQRLTVDELRKHRPELVDELLREQSDRLAQLEAELQRHAAVEAVTQRRRLVGRLLAERGLPDPEQPGWGRAVVGGRFLETLMAAPDEAAVRALIEERAELVCALKTTPAAPQPGGKPTSREAGFSAPSPRDTKTFVEAIT